MKKLVTRLARRPKASEEEATRPAKEDVHHGFQQVYPAPNIKGKERDENTVEYVFLSFTLVRPF